MPSRDATMSIPASSPSRQSCSSGASPSYIGKRVGPYVICQEIAAGGMATVFLARRLPGNGFVALKAIHRHLAERSDFVEMFRDEAQIGLKLHHPNICRVYDLDALDGTYFLAMEYLMGETLSSLFRRVARRTPGDVRRHAALVAHLAAGACSGLHAAHELRDADGALLNVVHRDVSPDNVLLTYAGEIKVMDFGLASAAQQTHRTRTGIIKGKFGYIAPELLSGSKADRRADVWSLGVVVWELLTGRRLFRRDSDAETLSAVAQAPILPPSQVRAGLPSQLDGPVMRALEREPSQRYASALELGRDLLTAFDTAASIHPSDVADWMGQHFPDERRRKAQLLELVERLGTPDFGTSSSDFDDDLTRIKSRTLPARSAERPSAGLVGYAHSVVKLSRQKPLVSAAGMAGLLLAVSALAGWTTRSTPVPHPSEAPAPQAAVAKSSQPQLPAPKTLLTNQHGTPEPSATTTEGRVFELPQGRAYVLEISDADQRPGTVLLKIRPEAPRKPKLTRPMPPAVPLVQAPDAVVVPPAWLQQTILEDRRARPPSGAGSIAIARASSQ
jgi:eukaryotic-like serine/threonine-protein kinase